MSDLKRVGRRDGPLQMVAAGPVMLASLAVLVLLSGLLGRWAFIPPLVWLALTGVWITPRGERVAVRVAYRYRQSSAENAGHLRAALAVADSRTTVGIGGINIYVRAGTGNSINAYAVGRRSIAVSEGLAAAVAHGRLTMAQVGALLAHEIGHLRSGGTRYGLAIAWLSAPWRVVVATLGLTGRLSVGKVPTAWAGSVVLGPVVLAIAAVHGVQQHAWAPLATIIMVGVLLIVQPLAEAALSRSEERAADAYAVACGLGPDLAAALEAIDQFTARDRPRAWASHPARAGRVRDLAAASPSRSLIDAC